MKKTKIFLSKDRYLPLLAGLASGLYPWAFYFTNNFDFVNSRDHFLFFLTRFVLFPTLGYYLVFFLMHKKYIGLFKKHLLPTLNAVVFFTLLMFAVYAAVRWKHIVVIGFLSFLVFLATFFVKRVLQKIMVLQLLMVFTTLFNLTGIVKEHYSYSGLWMQQPDDIKKVVFKKNPNIYIIQVDGYVNFSELKKGYYNFDNTVFENWLLERGYVFYEDFRSNYKNTIYSNTSMFSMKHHHYNTYNERNVLMNENAVVKIFNANNYKTHALLEVPYFLINRPQITFDYTNFSLDQLPYFSRGLSNKRNIIDDFKASLKSKAQNNFYFFEKLQPWHVTVQKSKSKGKVQERKNYLERLKKANIWMMELISLIDEVDPDGLVVLMADHGGFVGMNSTAEALEKMDDRDLIYSVFSSLMAVKWPKNQAPHFDKKLKSSVNLFRILFSYLSDDESYLICLQEDASYLQVNEGAPEGIYKYIDSHGKIVFEKLE